MKRQRVQRALEGDFDFSSFYTFHNPSSPNNTLSSGINQDSSGAIDMTLYGSLSSENWQIYYQQGRYFIRNYDWGDFQLGLTEGARSVPKLMRRSGALGQQWTLARTDGGWTLANGLLGNGSWLSVVGGNAPAMQPAETGATWEILINESAGAPKGNDLYMDVSDFMVATMMSSISTATPKAPLSPIASSTASIPASSTASIPASTTTSPSETTSASLIPGYVEHISSSSSLSPGAIGGIAVGAVALVAALSALIFFLLRRRKQKIHANAAELVGSAPVEKVVYAHRAEIGSEPMIHVAQEKGMLTPRFELDGTSASKSLASPLGSLGAHKG